MLREIFQTINEYPYTSIIIGLFIIGIIKTIKGNDD